MLPSPCTALTSWCGAVERRQHRKEASEMQWSSWTWCSVSWKKNKNLPPPCTQNNLLLPSKHTHRGVTPVFMKLHQRTTASWLVHSAGLSDDVLYVHKRIPCTHMQVHTTGKRCAHKTDKYLLLYYTIMRVMNPIWTRIMRTCMYEHICAQSEYEWKPMKLSVCILKKCILWAYINAYILLTKRMECVCVCACICMYIWVLCIHAHTW